MKQKRLISALLILAICLSLLPAFGGFQAFAANTAEPAESHEINILSDSFGGGQRGRNNNGFVQNIEFWTATNPTDGYVYFDSFNESDTEYDVEIASSFLPTNRMSIFIYADSDEELNYSFTVKKINGDITFTGASKIVESPQLVSGITGTLAQFCPVGEKRILEINVHRPDEEENGDVYVFNITRSPVLNTFSVTANGQALELTPPFNNQNSAYTRMFVAQTKEDTITLKGTTQPLSGVSFYLTASPEQDLTASFKGAGVEVDLKDEKYEADEYGVYIPFSLVYDENTRSDYTLYVYTGDPVQWDITDQSEDSAYSKNSSDVEIFVETDLPEEDAIYQWYSGSSRTQAFRPVSGATGPTYHPVTDKAGKAYYKCVVTDKKTKLSKTSDIIEVTVNPGKPNAPVFYYDNNTFTYSSIGTTPPPYQTTYMEGEAIHNLTILAGTNEKDYVNFEYEWFYNTVNSYDGAESISIQEYEPKAGRTRDGLFFYVLDYRMEGRLPAGKHYLFCKISTVAKDEYASGDPALDKTSVLTAILEITITPREKLDGFEGNGLPDDPYLVNSADQLKLIAEAVDSGDPLTGVWFRFTKDITLPEDWDPIGDIGDPSNPYINSESRFFSGIIDGNGKKLTVPEGGRPLLELTRDAVVRNLNIYGAQINGAGLLDKVRVDYGDDGKYVQFQEPDVITVENVTLMEGSSTLGSGLVNGGYYSGDNNVFINNCKIEEGVIVGYDGTQSNIGSFVGTLNGRVDNSVSYATVKGKDFVGGLVGRKGQAMGLCDVTNSAFLGTIEATGSEIGGIMGAGYAAESAGNTPPVTIRNCYAAANISGAAKIGGILGSEDGLAAAYNVAHISDNFYYGTITANSYEQVGGIVGALGSYNQEWQKRGQLQFYENNYYLANEAYKGLGNLRFEYPEANPTWDPEEDSFIAATAEEFLDGTILDCLNNGKYSFGNWIQGEKYPVIDREANLDKVIRLEIDKESQFKVVYYVGEELSLSGMKLTATSINGERTSLTPGSDGVSITNYNPQLIGDQNVTVTYNGVSTSFTVSVIRRYDDGGTIDDTISVKFALIGSTKSDGNIDLGNEDLLYRGASYETWIELTEYKMAVGATVLELFDRALKQANLPYSITSMNNYVDSINGLAEFTNGPRSGWMYTVGKKDDGSDGSHPDLGLSEYVLDNGDVIIWHYVNDYLYEVRDWLDKEAYPSLGQDGKYYSLWLKALTSGSYTPPSGSGSYTPPSGSGGITDSGTVLAPKVTASNGMATATVTASDMTSAIDEAKTNGSDFIVIAPEITGAAKKVSVELPKASVSSVASDTDADLKIETSVGNVTIPNDVLASVVSQASGDTISIMVESVEIKTLTADQQKLVGDGAVFDISIISGDKFISSFSGKSITISLPYSLKTGETADGVTVWYLSDDGKLERMACTYDKATGLATFATSHLSNYVVGYDAWQNPFTDVKTGDWFYDAVRYAVEKELFNGTSETTFAPNADMTRAMLVTVLHRLEGRPAVTGTNSFSDVKSGEWYTDAVIWATANGIVGGYGNDLFGTDDPITREQMATMLLRYAEYKKYDTAKANDLAVFTDANGIASYALDAMKWANAEGLITGRTATTLAPTGTATRAEVATILMRFAENVVK